MLDVRIYATARNHPPREHECSTLSLNPPNFVEPGGLSVLQQHVSLDHPYRNNLSFTETPYWGQTLAARRPLAHSAFRSKSLRTLLMYTTAGMVKYRGTPLFPSQATMQHFLLFQVAARIQLTISLYVAHWSNWCSLYWRAEI